MAQADRGQSTRGISRHSRFTLAVWTVLALLAPSVSANDAPNILILLADDLGWADVGYHSDRVETPAIDQLARDGIRLERMTVAPMCSPTRAGLMTGRYPIRFGMARAVIPPYRDYGLPAEETTLAEMLAESGYRRRAAFGKWHLGHRRPEWHPLSQGFTYFHGHYNGAIDYFTLEREGERDWHTNRTPSAAQGYSTDLIGNGAAEWIEQQGEEHPWFCYVAFNAPHSPFQAREDDLSRFEGQGNDQSAGVAGLGGRAKQRAEKRETLAAMIYRLDQAIGNILDTLDRTGQADNTIVWFLSDNGGIRDLPDNNLPLRGNKLDVFEGGVRVPCCVRWPARWKGGRRIDIPVNCIDILPTIRTAVGAVPTADAQRPPDGLSLEPLLDGTGDTLPPRDLYFYHGQSGPRNEKIAVSSPGWKLVVNGPRILKDGPTDDHQVFLFRFPEDLQETTNLAAHYPQITADLFKKLVTFRNLQPANGVPPYGDNKPADFRPPKNWELTP